MTSDIEKYITYFRQLAISSVDIQHTEDIPGFFAFDWQKFISAKKKADTILFLQPFHGHISGNSSENPLDIARVQWSIFRKMNDKVKGEPERVVRETKAIAQEFIARMYWHQNTDPDHTYCELLHYLNLDEIEYRVEDVYEDGWTGFRVITPLADVINLEMNPTKWL